MSIYFDIATMNQESIKKANKLNIPDYEDALQYAMALQHGCEYFITRNVKDFRKVEHIKVVTAGEFFMESEI